MLKVVGLRGGEAVELFDDGSDGIEFRPQGVTFETRASAEETLRHASQHDVSNIEFVEV